MFIYPVTLGVRSMLDAFQYYSWPTPVFSPKVDWPLDIFCDGHFFRSRKAAIESFIFSPIKFHVNRGSMYTEISVIPSVVYAMNWWLSTPFHSGKKCVGYPRPNLNSHVFRVKYSQINFPVLSLTMVFTSLMNNHTNNNWLKLFTSGTRAFSGMMTFELVVE